MRRRSTRVAALGGRDEREEAGVEPFGQVLLHGSQERVDRGEVVRGPGEGHPGLNRYRSVGDGRESAGDGDPAGGLDDRLSARRAPGPTAVGWGVDCRLHYLYISSDRWPRNTHFRLRGPP